MKKNLILLLSAFVIDAQEKMTITNGIIILKHQCPFEPIKAKTRKQIAF
jgi:hypothetical protein